MKKSLKDFCKSAQSVDFSEDLCKLILTYDHAKNDGNLIEYSHLTSDTLNSNTIPDSVLNNIVNDTTLEDAIQMYLDEHLLLDLPTTAYEDFIEGWTFGPHDLEPASLAAFSKLHASTGEDEIFYIQENHTNADIDVVYTRPDNMPWFTLPTPVLTEVKNHVGYRWGADGWINQYVRTMEEVQESDWEECITDELIDWDEINFCLDWNSLYEGKTYKDVNRYLFISPLAKQKLLSRAAHC